MPNLLSDMYGLDKKDENVGKEFLFGKYSLWLFKYGWKLACYE